MLLYYILDSDYAMCKDGGTWNYVRRVLRHGNMEFQFRWFGLISNLRLSRVSACSRDSRNHHQDID
jgi:hypothetical protein